MDWVIVYVCADSLCATEYQVFDWGHGGLDPNTNIGAAGYSTGEGDNEAIPASVLWASSGIQTGIAIDIDPFVPDGAYQYIRIYSPIGGSNDPSQIDAIEVITP
jgi:hypothetical protein